VVSASFRFLPLGFLASSMSSTLTFTSKRVDVKVKDEESDIKVEAKVTAAVSLKIPKEEDGPRL
jgi:hypothetical protein